MADQCKHNKAHAVDASIGFMEDTGRFTAEVRIVCADCGLPFQFLGLPLGLDMEGAAMSADGLEARLAIAPMGTVPQPLDSHLLRGFRVKSPMDH